MPEEYFVMVDIIIEPSPSLHAPLTDIEQHLSECQGDCNHPIPEYVQALWHDIRAYPGPDSDLGRQRRIVLLAQLVVKLADLPLLYEFIADGMLRMSRNLADAHLEYSPVASILDVRLTRLFAAERPVDEMIGCLTQVQRRLVKHANHGFVKVPFSSVLNAQTDFPAYCLTEGGERVRAVDVPYRTLVGNSLALAYWDDGNFRKHLQDVDDYLKRYSGQPRGLFHELLHINMEAQQLQHAVLLRRFENRRGPSTELEDWGLSYFTRVGLNQEIPIKKKEEFQFLATAVRHFAANGEHDFTGELRSRLADNHNTALQSAHFLDADPIYPVCLGPEVMRLLRTDIQPAKEHESAEVQVRIVLEEMTNTKAMGLVGMSSLTTFNNHTEELQHDGVIVEVKSKRRLIVDRTAAARWRKKWLHRTTRGRRPAKRHLLE
jgi:hypothetical protein